MQTHPVYTRYAASLEGKVYSRSNKRELTGSLRGGYLRVSLTHSGRLYHRHLHVVVWECFHGVVPSGYEIDHIDSNNKNNKLANLQVLDKTAHRQKTSRGRGVWTAPKLHKKVARLDAAGVETVYSSMTEAAKAINGCISGVSAAVAGRFPHYKGFTWTFLQADDLRDERWACPISAELKGLQISNKGRVRSKLGVCSYGYDADGYKKVRVNNKGFFVHRLVAQSFLGAAPTARHTVDHVDQCQSNNDVSNLRWATPETQANNKGNACAVEAWCLVTQSVLDTWTSIAEAARAVGVDRDCFYRALQSSSAINGRTFRRAVKTTIA